MANKTKVFASQLRGMPDFIAVFKLLTNLRLLMCMVTALVMGAGIGIISTFLFWHLQVMWIPLCNMPRLYNTSLHMLENFSKIIIQNIPFCRIMVVLQPCLESLPLSIIYLKWQLISLFSKSLERLGMSRFWPLVCFVMFAGFYTSLLSHGHGLSFPLSLYKVSWKYRVSFG